MKKFILLIFAVTFVTSTGNLYAQLKDNYIKGTITLTDGKEIQGYIKQLEFEKINKQVFYKSSPDDKNQTVYLSNKVKQISLETGAIYELLTSKVPKSNDTVSFLASLLLRGKASLYETSYNQRHIYIIVNNGTTYWLQDDEIEDGALVRYHFKNMLFVALNGVDENEVTRIAFDEKSLTAIVSKYNKSLGAENEIVKAKQRKTSFIIAGLGGMYKQDTENEFYLQAFHRVYFPSISQNTSLNIGLSYFRNVHEDNIYGNRNKVALLRNLYSLPVYIQQNLLNKRIRPYLFGGLNISYISEEIKESKISVLSEEGLQQNYGLGFLLGGGIEADVLKRILVRTEYRYENFPHLIMLGLAYKFQL